MLIGTESRAIAQSLAPAGAVLIKVSSGFVALMIEAN